MCSWPKILFALLVVLAAAIIGVLYFSRSPPRRARRSSTGSSRVSWIACPKRRSLRRAKRSAGSWTVTFIRRGPAPSTRWMRRNREGTAVLRDRRRDPRFTGRWIHVQGGKGDAAAERGDGRIAFAGLVASVRVHGREGLRRPSRGNERGSPATGGFLVLEVGGDACRGSLRIQRYHEDAREDQEPK